MLKWAAHIDGSLYTGLKTIEKELNLIKILKFYLHFRSKQFNQIIYKNFVNHSNIKSIVGSIYCCPFFEPVVRIHRVWLFRAKLDFNVTFLYFNVGHIKYEFQGHEGEKFDEYVKFVKLYTSQSQYWKNAFGKIYSGRRNKMTFLTELGSLYFESFTFPFPSSETKLKISFFVVDNVLVKFSNINDILHQNMNQLDLRYSSETSWFRNPKSVLVPTIF